MNKKNVVIHLISLCLLLVSFVLCRYVFIFHKMYQLPVLLFVIGLIILACSFWAKAQIVPIISSAAYLIGFTAGSIFQTDGVDAGGARTNNLWIIWTAVFVCTALASVIAEVIYGSIKKQYK